MDRHFLLGIDEAGRGPIAGPVSVGAVVIFDPENLRYFRRIRDSKQLSSKEREQWLARMRQAEKKGMLKMSVALIDSRAIDRKGIVYAIKCGIKACLGELAVSPDMATILLDGSLHAPRRFKDQTTIIRGDETEPIIAMASIVAKVTRDRVMIELGRRFAGYGFERHKGYGTALHYERLAAFGPCPIHRRSFLSTSDVDTIDKT